MTSNALNTALTRREAELSAKDTARAFKKATDVREVIADRFGADAAAALTITPHSPKYAMVSTDAASFYATTEWDFDEGDSEIVWLYFYTKIPARWYNGFFTMRQPSTAMRLLAGG